MPLKFVEFFFHIFCCQILISYYVVPRHNQTYQYWLKDNKLYAGSVTCNFLYNFHSSTWKFCFIIFFYFHNGNIPSIFLFFLVLYFLVSEVINTFNFPILWRHRIDSSWSFHTNAGFFEILPYEMKSKIGGAVLQNIHFVSLFFIQAQMSHPKHFSNLA